MSCASNLLNQTLCFSNGGECEVFNATLSSCLCPNGRKGDNCEELKVPLGWVYGICYGLVITFVGISSFMSRRGYLKSQDDYAANILKGTVTHHRIFNKQFLLVYRVCVFIWFFLTHVIQLAANGAIVYAFYTIWNLILLIIYFAIGSALSGFDLFKGTEHAKNNAYFGRLATIHYIIFEVALPSALLVDFVLWALLYNSCKGGCTGLLNYYSIVQHIFNLVMIFIDMLICSYTLAWNHHWYIVIWMSLYGMFEMAFTLIRDSTYGHAPTYFFFNMGSPFAPLWLIALVIVNIAFYYGLYFFTRYGLGRKFEDHAEQFNEQKEDGKTRGEIAPHENNA